MRRAVLFIAVIMSLALLIGSALSSTVPNWQDAAAASAPACADHNGGVTLPRGFCATVFADKIGHARHMAVAPDGVVYVNTWSGRYYGEDTPPPGGMLVALQDTNGDGEADISARFGDTFAQGNHGGTGIEIYKGALYAETNDRIVRYELPKGGMVPTGVPENVVSGLPLSGDHPMHPFAIDAEGQLFVDVASATNSCQPQNRMPKVLGAKPCTELKTRAGIWRYDANKTGQKFSAAERFATGIRNADGIAIDPSGSGLFATQHGRDELYEDWPKLYDQEQGANLPAEELLQIWEGGDFGWPECYYDDRQEKLVLAPEYGGDGGKKVGVCAEKKGPVAAFPAHWAPNDLLLYAGGEFPAAYRGGAFEGKRTGDYIVFADGFAGGHKDPGEATHRPSGLAVGPDGALYISDDQHGRIWRITYHGDKAVGIEPAPQVKMAKTKSATAAQAEPPEGIHPDAGKTAALPTPPGQTAEQVALGEHIFHGQEGGTCAGCHGANAKGTPLAPNLADGKWLWGDGSIPSIAATITKGVPQPRNYRSGMPPMGGAQLNPTQVLALADYIWALNQTGRN